MAEVAHDAKAIAFAKWSVWVKNSNAKKVPTTIVRAH